jgi:hypothetical protein
MLELHEETKCLIETIQLFTFAYRNQTRNEHQRHQYNNSKARLAKAMGRININSTCCESKQSNNNFKWIRNNPLRAHPKIFECLKQHGQRFDAEISTATGTTNMKSWHTAGLVN